MQTLLAADTRKRRSGLPNHFNKATKDNTIVGVTTVPTRVAAGGTFKVTVYRKKKGGGGLNVDVFFLSLGDEVPLVGGPKKVALNIAANAVSRESANITTVSGKADKAILVVARAGSQYVTTVVRLTA